MQSVREGEKANIARELHDELGHTLTAVNIDLALITAKLSPNNGSEQLIREFRL